MDLVYTRVLRFYVAFMLHVVLFFTFHAKRISPNLDRKKEGHIENKDTSLERKRVWAGALKERAYGDWPRWSVIIARTPLSSRTFLLGDEASMTPLDPDFEDEVKILRERVVSPPRGEDLPDITTAQYSRRAGWGKWKGKKGRKGKREEGAYFSRIWV